MKQRSSTIPAVWGKNALTVAAQERGERGGAQAAGRPAEELTARQVEAVLAEGVHQTLSCRACRARHPIGKTACGARPALRSAPHPGVGCVKSSRTHLSGKD